MGSSGGQNWREQNNDIRKEQTGHLGDDFCLISHTMYHNVSLSYIEDNSVQFNKVK